MRNAEREGDVVVHTHGPVTAGDAAYGRGKIAAVFTLAPGPVLYAKLDLTLHGDPARPRPASAKAELDLGGRFVRGHATGTTVPEAVDALEARLRERLERVVHRDAATHLRHRGDGDAWMHGNARTVPPAYFPRPVDDREVVRRKSFALGALSPEEALLEMGELDHDFYLFTSAETGDDNLVFRTADGAYELIEPTPTMTSPRRGISPSRLRPSVMGSDAAIELLDLGDEPFVFFVDAETGRGNVVYRRYDGHYGLILPADVT